ncbi:MULTISPECIES: cytochrome c550 [Thalassobacillus]|uniref:cytochrome c550 n=1 Tax=Thalassobacillus TaxID=331971 RepID=UPI000A1CA437|nr:cytochrome c [Thalassobacillus devorans]
MKRNPVIPFAMIAVIGILTMFIISWVGVGQNEAIQNEGENGEEQQEEEASSDPEEVFQNSCAACHGADLSGGNGPSLETIGSKYSAEEIEEIIINGKGSMPPGQAQGEEATLVAEWLAEKQ